MNRLARIRSAAFLRQNGLCYYCEQPMWQQGKEQFASAHSLSIKQAGPFQCTAEHLRPRQDGGRDTQGNIAAACRFCNSGRHKRKVAPSPEEFCQDVRRRMARGAWHAFRPR